MAARRASARRRPLRCWWRSHSGIVEVGADGTATVTFDMPDFSGTVRLMAMAWTAKAVGHASADVIVRDPVVVTLSPPRFLRLDDESRLLVEINNVGGPAGTYRVELLDRRRPRDRRQGQPLSTSPTGERTALNLALTGTAIGDQDLKLIVTDPDGNALVKELTLGRPRHQRAAHHQRADPDRAGRNGRPRRRLLRRHLVPHTGALTLAIGPIARLDVPGLLLALDRYPYGCAEQVSSRALPLLYLNEVAQTDRAGHRRRSSTSASRMPSPTCSPSRLRAAASASGGRSARRRYLARLPMSPTSCCAPGPTATPCPSWR